jgi:hypothetical protein
MLMPSGMVLLPLELEEFVNSADCQGIATTDAHFAASRPIDRFVADRGAALRHYVSARHLLRVHLKWLAEIAGAKRGLDVAHVCADRGYGSGVTRVVAIQHDPPTVGQVLEYVRGGVLIDAHDVRAARLHRGEVLVRVLAARA